MADVSAPLNQAAGYGIVVGLGMGFCVLMMGISWLLARYQRDIMTSEEFSTAGRSVKTGLVAAAVVSSWTWAATLLQSSTVAYEYGVSGPFWYAAGACVQIVLFATIAIELKRKAPHAHTFLEVMKARYGPIGHCTFMAFGLFTNILVTVMLLTGGSATISYLTGMNTVACCFLLPLGVAVYTMFGGLKATIITDWIHTFILLIIILIFAFSAYAVSDRIGSPKTMYDLLVAAAEAHPVSGNAEGSYLTMRSKQGAIFFVINLVGNFGTVFLDSGYWNKAIAASPASALPGYIFGGLAWFAIPWLCATTMGLTCLALEGSEWFPVAGRMTAAEVSAGLVLPHAAVALLGQSGAWCTLIIVFMAVTSATSSELIAVSTIFTYDVYKAYINPKATGKKLIWVSHMGVCAYGAIMAGFATGLYYAGIGMGYLYLLMGVIVSACVFPAICSLMWSKTNLLAATASPILGTAFALIAWLVTAAKKNNGVLSVETTGSNDPMLAGNVTALLSPLILVPVFTFIRPANYDWKSMKAIRRDDDSEFATKEVPAEELDLEPEIDEHEFKMLTRAAKIARTTTVCLAIALLVVWPFPMYGTQYIFTPKFFTGWVVVGILWLFFTLFFVGVFPLWEGRKAIYNILHGMYSELSGKGLPPPPPHPGMHHPHGVAHNAEFVSGQEISPNDSLVEIQQQKSEKNYDA